MDQADKLRTLSSINSDAEMPRIISITSGKGGVGKTNVAVNLAVLLARKGLRVLLVDADFGLANVNLMIGCRPEKTIDDVMFGSTPIKDVFVTTRFGFDLLPSSSGFRKLLDLDSFEQRTMFDHLFSSMGAYDIVIYDTAPGLGAHVMHFNSMADDIVVLAQAEPSAIADAYALIKVLHHEKREKKFRLLINRVREGQEGLDAFKKLTGVSEEFLNISIDFLGSLPEDLAVLRAARVQRPLASDAPRSPFVTALERIADKLLATANPVFGRNVWNNGAVANKRMGSRI